MKYFKRNNNITTTNNANFIQKRGQSPFPLIKIKDIKHQKVACSLYLKKVILIIKENGTGTISMVSIFLTQQNKMLGEGEIQ